MGHRLPVICMLNLSMSESAVSEGIDKDSTVQGGERGFCLGWDLHGLFLF